MKEIQLTQGKVALVDDEDYDFINKWKWYAKKDPFAKTYYAARKKDGERGVILMHREILQIKDAKLFCDHEDHNGLNNQRNNIRIATRSQNNANKQSTGSSKYLGVSWDWRRNKWKAEIRKNKLGIFIGRFKDEKEAAVAYNQRAKELHGEFANLNIV